MPNVPIDEITPAQLKQLLETGEPIVLLDVREPYEWDITNLAHIGAIHIPLAQLADRYTELDPEADIVVYCRSGGRSMRAARFLAANGFQNVRNLDSGVNGWARDVDPSMPVY